MINIVKKCCAVNIAIAVDILHFIFVKVLDNGLKIKMFTKLTRTIESWKGEADQTRSFIEGELIVNETMVNRKLASSLQTVTLQPFSESAEQQEIKAKVIANTTLVYENARYMIMKVYLTDTMKWVASITFQALIKHFS